MEETRIIHGNALDLPLEDDSVDLVVTSPPYFALRSYRDEGDHYDGQVGSEATPQEFLEALWAATAEMMRVLKPTGSIWVNLGDKYAGSGGHNNNGLGKSGLINSKKYLEGRSDQGSQATRRNAPDRYNQNAGGIPAKSLMMLPARYAIGCVDRFGLILRAEVIWSKPNGLPESVTDRVRRSHEVFMHFTKSPRYFSAVDEIREAHSGEWPHHRTAPNKGQHDSLVGGRSAGLTANGWVPNQNNPLGKLPGSVWTIPSEPLVIPEALGLPDHFAAFPTEWPRRIILGWSPSGICTSCGEGRRPVVDAHYLSSDDNGEGRSSDEMGRHRLTNRWGDGQVATITGYACACTPCEKCRGEREYLPGVRTSDPQGPPESDLGNGTSLRTTEGPVLQSLLCDAVIRESQPCPYCDPAPTRPSVILDPFCGTGTTILVARSLDRIGIGVDLSKDYCRLAEWRVFHSGHGAKAERRTWAERQLGLL